MYDLVVKGSAEGLPEHFESFFLDLYNLKVREVAKAWEQYSPARSESTAIVPAMTLVYFYESPSRSRNS